jgi:hypothetical protein
VEEWYWQMLIITRSYLTAAVVTTVGCTLEVCSGFPLHLLCASTVYSPDFTHVGACVFLRRSFRRITCTSTPSWSCSCTRSGASSPTSSSSARWVCALDLKRCELFLPYWCHASSCMHAFYSSIARYLVETRICCQTSLHENELHC